MYLKLLCMLEHITSDRIQQGHSTEQQTIVMMLYAKGTGKILLNV